MDEFREMAQARQRDVLKILEHEMRLADARNKGYDTSGPVARVVRTALSRLITAVGM